MIDTIIPTIATAFIGAISAIWSYWVGRKKTASENAIKKTEALRELNETVDQQCRRINDLYELILTLKRENYKLTTQNEQLLANQNVLKSEIESLRTELSRYRKSNGEKQHTNGSTTKNNP